MTKEYAEKCRDLITAWNSYSLNGDTASARIVDQDVKKFMSDYNITEYGEALRLRRREVKEMENEFNTVPSAFDSGVQDAGAELHKIALRNQSLAPHLNYSMCLKAACAENPRLAARYTGKPVRTDLVQETQQFFAQQNEARKYEEQGRRTNDQIVANIISGIPKIAGTMEMDIPMILQALNAFGGDVLAGAAKERLDVLTRDALAQEGIPGSEASKREVMAAIRRRVESRFKELKAVADGGAITERGLRQLSPQHFK